MIPTAQRVHSNTAPPVQTVLDQRLQQNIARCTEGGLPAIRQRLAQLDREWNVERFIEIEAPLMIALGAALALRRDRRWLGLSAFAAAMVLTHSFQGWYPLLPVLRRLGVRSQDEIEEERMALLVLLGEHRRYQAGRTAGADHAAVLH